MAAEDSTTTWGEVCKKVGFADNLYRDCRKNVPDFPLGGTPSNRAFDEVPDADYGPGTATFDKELADSALAAPPPPPADWKPKPGFLEDLPIQQILMYGGVAAVVWLLILQARKKQQTTTSMTSVPNVGAVPSEKVTSPRAA